MSDTTPERTVPAEVERAIENYFDAVMTLASEGDRANYKAALNNLYAKILAALEPDRELRARTERLRLSLIESLDHVRTTAYLTMPYTTGDLADDLAATSSTEGEGE